MKKKTKENIAIVMITIAVISIIALILHTIGVVIPDDT